MNIFYKYLLFSIIAIFLLSSCESEDYIDNIITVDLNRSDITYDDNGVWSNILTAEEKVISQGIIFSHDATQEWNVWSGFTVSRNSDTADYTQPFCWLDHQCTAITGGGVSGRGTPYLIAYWDTMEDRNVSLDNAVCSIKYTVEGASFMPQSIYVTNSSYSYYTMINGTDYSKKFTTGDFLNLLIYGITANGERTGPVTVTLANYTTESSTPLYTWEYVNLESLGEVAGIYFQMESSDTGKWGINTPTYFAIDRLSIKVM